MTSSKPVSGVWQAEAICVAQGKRDPPLHSFQITQTNQVIMSLGITNTVSEQLREINFTNEDFNQLRKALEDQQKKTEGPLLFNNGRLNTTWGNWLEAYQPNYMKDQSERSYEQSIELQYKLIQLKRLVSQTIPKPEETEEPEECNCFICSLKRMVKKSGGAGIEVVVSKNGIPKDEPMTRNDPKGSHTES